MKASPLKQLVDLARKDENFLQLLFRNRKRALRQAASKGIELSPEERKLVGAILSQERVVLTPNQSKKLFPSLQSKTERLFGASIFWPSICTLIIIWKRGAKQTFRKRALRGRKPPKGGQRGSKSRKR